MLLSHFCDDMKTEKEPPFSNGCPFGAGLFLVFFHPASSPQHAVLGYSFPDYWSAVSSSHGGVFFTAMALVRMKSACGDRICMPWIPCGFADSICSAFFTILGMASVMQVSSRDGIGRVRSSAHAGDLVVAAAFGLPVSCSCTKIILSNRWQRESPPQGARFVQIYSRTGRILAWVCLVVISMCFFSSRPQSAWGASPTRFRISSTLAADPAWKNPFPGAFGITRRRWYFSPMHWDVIETDLWRGVFLEMWRGGRAWSACLSAKTFWVVFFLWPLPPRGPGKCFLLEGEI